MKWKSSWWMLQHYYSMNFNLSSFLKCNILKYIKLSYSAQSSFINMICTKASVQHHKAYNHNADISKKQIPFSDSTESAWLEWSKLRVPLRRLKLNRAKITSCRSTVLFSADSENTSKISSSETQKPHHNSLNTIIPPLNFIQRQHPVNISWHAILTKSCLNHVYQWCINFSAEGHFMWPAQARSVW